MFLRLPSKVFKLIEPFGSSVTERNDGAPRRSLLCACVSVAQAANSFLFTREYVFEKSPPLFYTHNGRNTTAMATQLAIKRIGPLRRSKSGYIHFAGPKPDRKSSA